MGRFSQATGPSATKPCPASTAQLGLITAGQAAPGAQLPEPTAGALGGRVVFLVASSDYRAQAVLSGLVATGRFRCVSAPGILSRGVAFALRNYSQRPLPGLHGLATPSCVVAAARRLYDDIVNSVGRQQGSAGIMMQSAPLIMYAPEYVRSAEMIRLLYPDAAIAHLTHDVRTPSAHVCWKRPRDSFRVHRVYREWRISQQKMLGSPPWLTQVRLRSEDVRNDPHTAADAFGRLAGIQLTADQRAAFAAAVAVPPSGSRQSLLARVLTGLSRWSAGISCQAELAELDYLSSPGQPGIARRFLAATLLRLAPLTVRDDG
jgi:hypothetical protein